MSLRGLLALLPAGLLALVLLVMAMLVLQNQRSQQLFDEVRITQSQRDSLGVVRTVCGDLTQNAVAWTLTRRATQGKQYADGKSACQNALARVSAAMPHAAAPLTQLKQRIEQLATLLETIQGDHTDDTKMVTVGRLEREVQPLARAIGKEIDTLARSADAQAEALMGAVVAQQQHALWVTGVAGALAILLGAALVVFVMRRILAAVGQAGRIARAVADGDLTVEPREQRDDELGKLVAATNHGRHAWIAAIGELRIAASRIDDAAGDISRGASALNDHSVHAASSLRTTAGAMQGLLDMVASSTRAAHDASSLAGDATREARAGSAAVSDLTQTMNDIRASSAKIAEIISVIDGIAFQTNILALNAAVEAARAGEQGRGFAVVASEVRALAQRSSQAAGEIRDLIKNSVERIENGASSADGARRKIDDVSAAIDKVSAVIRGVADAAQRQNQEIDQLANTIQELDQLTNDNTLRVSAWTQSAEELLGESQRLSALMARFRLPRTSGGNLAAQSRQLHHPVDPEKT